MTALYLIHVVAVALANSVAVAAFIGTYLSVWGYVLFFAWKGLSFLWGIYNPRRWLWHGKS